MKKSALCLSLLMVAFMAIGQFRVIQTFDNPVFIRTTESVTINDLLFFPVYNQQTKQVDLWKSDGTEPGTGIFKSICTYDYAKTYFESKSFGDVFIYAFNSGTGSIKEYWISDGTSNGTQKLNINSFSNEYVSNLETFIRGENKIFFAHRDSATGSRQISSIDISSLERIPVTRADFVYHPNATLPFSVGAAFQGPTKAYLNGFLYFGGEQWDENSESGQELYKCNISTGEISLVKNINPNGFAGIGAIYSCNGKIYFSTGEPAGIWVTDGTTDGTIQLSANDDLGCIGLNFAPLGYRCIFEYETNANGREAWVTDGTAEGTSLIKDINEGSASSLNGVYYPRFQNFSHFNDKLYFIAEEGSLKKVIETMGEPDNTTQLDIPESVIGLFLSNNNLIITGVRNATEHSAKVWSFKNSSVSLIGTIENIASYNVIGSTSNTVFFATQTSDYSKMELMVPGNDDNQSSNIENISDLKMSIFPNPVTETVTFEIPDKTDKLDYSIIDLYGHCLQNGNFSSKASFDVSTFTKGIYFVTIKNNNVSQFGKFIKK